MSRGGTQEILGVTESLGWKFLVRCWPSWVLGQSQIPWDAWTRPRKRSVVGLKSQQFHQTKAGSTYRIPLAHLGPFEYRLLATKSSSSISQHKTKMICARSQAVKFKLYRVWNVGSLERTILLSDKRTGAWSDAIFICVLFFYCRMILCIYDFYEYVDTSIHMIYIYIYMYINDIVPTANIAVYMRFLLGIFRRLLKSV